MWFGPGVHVVAHVPVAGPTKNNFLLVIGKFAFCSENLFFILLLGAKHFSLTTFLVVFEESFT